MRTDLEQAISAHKAGDLEAAEALYRKVMSGKDVKPYVYQNLGALLREQRRNQEAAEIYDLGLAHYPDDPGILSNRANILRETAPISALQDLLKAVNSDPGLINAWITALGILSDFECFHYALHVARAALQKGIYEPRLLVNILTLLDKSSGADHETVQQLMPEFLSLIQLAARKLPLLERADALFGLACCCAQHNEASQALALYEETVAALSNENVSLSENDKEKRHRVITNHSWNLGCMLLKAGNLAEGWKLYDYGLRVPSKSPQQWQRALRKLYTADEVKIWRGENLETKSLLLLEEQGIGDTMMFLTLIPRLADEAQEINIVMSNRLAPLYKRALDGTATVWTHDEIREAKSPASNYDYQSALGSICRYRFTSISDYSPKVPILAVDEARVAKLRRVYRKHFGIGKKGLLIGISWRGGGNDSRVREKSVPLGMFEQLLVGHQEVGFVTLQYGDVKSIVRSWQNKGHAVHNDTEVDPLVDMDAWLHQVAACDAVVSVANTTIHGAGGLNIPTMCLLSKTSDWRWLNDSSVVRSYWYPSVGIARESGEAGWGDSLSCCKEWIASGCPMPTGPIAPPLA